MSIGNPHMLWAAFAMILASGASADTVNVKLLGVRYAHSNYDNSQVQITGAGMTSTWVIAGPEIWTRNSGSTTLGNSFDTFCVELTQHVGLNSSYDFSIDTVQNAPTPGTYVSGAMGPIKADYIRELWARHYGDVNSAETAVAFQTAIWEIVYENNGTKFSLSAGDFKATNSNAGANTLTTAQSWLNDITNPILANVPGANLVSLKSDGYQDQITPGPPVFAPPNTPLPSAASAGVAILGLVALKRRRH
ncbi:MAG: hypothetical protein JWN40_2453 [Phycisphaerales bacterium]|nr:hypothetical protein [Phycisphaerales bacterium]